MVGLMVPRGICHKSNETISAAPLVIHERYTLTAPSIFAVQYAGFSYRHTVELHNSLSSDLAMRLTTKCEL